MQRDILFFAKGIPSDYWLADHHFFMVKGDASAAELCELLRKEEPIFDLFCRKSSGKPLVYIGVRNSFESRDDSISDAHQVVSGLMDGYSMVLDEMPSLASTVLVRDGSSADASVLNYGEGGWAYFASPSKEGLGQWKARNQLVMTNLLAFFDLATGSNPISTELDRSLRYALKMFRHGSESQVFGIEYLCKFSALECLVCGTQTHKKEELLIARLCGLFENDEIVAASDVSKLWKIRCDASHYARAFDLDMDDKRTPIQIQIPLLDRLFAGVVYFLIEHISRAETVDSAWKFADTYTLPEIVTLHRPSSLGKMSVSRCVWNPHFSVKGAGPRFDHIYNDLKEKIKK